jgi:hypothetical protein
MPFKPGQSGNPGGRRKEKPYRDALRKVLAEEFSFGPRGVTHTKLEAIVREHVNKALAGDVAAIREIIDRMDGKVPQGVIGGEEDDAPISVALVELRAVYPKRGGPS